MERLMSTLDFLFGCHHSHLSRVFTIGGRSYRVCCDCGAKFKYSRASMCMQGRFKASNAQPRKLSMRPLRTTSQRLSFMVPSAIAVTLPPT